MSGFVTYNTDVHLQVHDPSVPGTVASRERCHQHSGERDGGADVGTTAASLVHLVTDASRTHTCG